MCVRARSSTRGGEGTGMHVPSGVTRAREQWQLLPIHVGGQRRDGRRGKGWSWYKSPEGQPPEIGWRMKKKLTGARI